MVGFVDTISESFKQTLNWPLWLYFFLILIIEVLVTGLIALVFILLGFVAFLGPITAVGGIENIAVLFSNMSFISSAIGVIGLLFIVFIIIATFIEAIFIGLRYNLFNDFLKTGKFDLGKAFQKTKPRIFTYFLISLIVSLIILAVFALAFAPAIFVLPALIGGAAIANTVLIAPLFFAVLLVFLVVLVILLISPMLSLIAPAAFFGNQGAFATIKKSFELMKANYFGNLAYVIFYVIIVVAIRMLLQVLLLPFTIMAGFMESVGGAIVGLLILVGIIAFLGMVVYIVWSTVFDTVCFRNLYFLDKSILSSNVPKHRAKPKRRKKKARKKSK